MLRPPFLQGLLHFSYMLPLTWPGYPLLIPFFLRSFALLSSPPLKQNSMSDLSSSQARLLQIADLVADHKQAADTFHDLFNEPLDSVLLVVRKANGQGQEVEIDCSNAKASQLFKSMLQQFFEWHYARHIYYQGAYNGRVISLWTIPGDLSDIKLKKPPVDTGGLNS